MYMSRFFDPYQPVKKLWQNLNSAGVKESTDNNNIMFTPDQLNNFFATASSQSTTPSQKLSTTSISRTTITKTTANSAGPSLYDECSISGTFDLEVFHAIYQINSVAIGMDNVPIKFLKMVLHT
jgi:hypothetical protein